MITDEGSHECLMAHTGTYRRLYDLQFYDVETASGTEWELFEQQRGGVLIVRRGRFRFGSDSVCVKL